MAVTLEWVRDHYDAISVGGNGNRIIDIGELQEAEKDWGAATITDQEYIAVLNAYHDKTLLPVYSTPTPPVCTAGAKRCRDVNTVEQCRADGSGWDIVQVCATGFKCENGSCVPVSAGAVTCSGSTPHYSSGCAMLLHYDSGGDGVLSMADYGAAITDSNNGVITAEELVFVKKAWEAGSINALCTGCSGVAPPPTCTPGDERCRDNRTIERCKTDGSGWYNVFTCGAGYECKDGKCVSVSPTPPPNMETRTMLLTEGQHTVQVSFNGYDTLNATINVSATGVTCVSVIGGACGGSSLPRVSTSGWTVTTYLKSGAVTTNRCTWIATKDTSKVAFISEMVLAYNNLANIGFTPSASEISQAVLMYAKLGTPASLWGC